MPVKPKIAATIVLLRESEPDSESDDDCEFEVFMVKRHGNARFMGGHHVFPGGGLETQDMTAESRARIIGPDKDIFNNIGDVCDQPSGLWIIAIRELFEETGLLIATRDGEEVIEINNENGAKFKDYQAMLQNDHLTMTEVLEKESLYYAANHLKYFGRLITPKISPIRFDTQFFLCKFPQNQNINLFGVELTEGLWGTPRELIKLFRKRQIKIIFPQYSTLKRLKKFKTMHEAFSNSKNGFKVVQVEDFRF